MADRLKKFERIRNVQEQLRRVADWELSQLQRRHADLKIAQESLIRSLNDDDRLYGLFLDAAAKRLKSYAVEAEEVEAQKSTQAEVALQRALQVKRTEKMMVGVKEAHRRGLEKKDLQEILDAVAAGGDASPA